MESKLSKGYTSKLENATSAQLCLLRAHQTYLEISVTYQLLKRKIDTKYGSVNPKLPNGVLVIPPFSSRSWVRIAWFGKAWFGEATQFLFRHHQLQPHSSWPFHSMNSLRLGERGSIKLTVFVVMLARALVVRSSICNTPSKMTVDIRVVFNTSFIYAAIDRPSLSRPIDVTHTLADSVQLVSTFRRIPSFTITDTLLVLGTH